MVTINCIKPTLCQKKSRGKPKVQLFETTVDANVVGYYNQDPKELGCSVTGAH